MLFDNVRISYRYPELCGRMLVGGVGPPRERRPDAPRSPTRTTLYIYSVMSNRSKQPGADRDAPRHRVVSAPMRDMRRAV